MRSIILRNRASAILGLLIVGLVFFSGLPDAWTNTLYVALGLLIAILGFTGNHYANKLYEEGYDELVQKNLADPEVAAVAETVVIEAEDSLPDDNSRS
ncbi:MAG: hypothetical protein A2589_02350 [Candidatus Vogelbacteria bacterium RIFOXYD1_FULL_46_19]|uniref:Uncharacterized protein n=1 Tax=Candidatus Vogelbacteria bacterium RIFOXYD1_FULL_46_19 TaxID=1802439 RepID=A0A1G2QGD9_9BACT|nr:MAG: hypothetical protein A2589_02350 [Candidatus Vogelbacteria bacterium RIFOXYD1_FULL_46_19]